jgi:Peptidase A4 family
MGFRFIHVLATIALGLAVPLAARAQCNDITVQPVKDHSTIWSGVLILDKLRRFAIPNDDGLHGQWYIPSFSAATFPKSRCDGIQHFSSQWVGFDGSLTKQILQAGTTANVTCTPTANGNSLETQYQAFWRWDGAARLINLPFNLTPGHRIDVTISPRGNGTTATIRFQDIDAPPNTDSLYSQDIQPDDGLAILGQTVEWVVEVQPNNQGSPANILSEYGTIFFSSNDVFVSNPIG